MNVIDNIRLNGFRQLKKEIRGSKKHLIVGIDVAKESHKAFFGTATGKTLLRRLVPVARPRGCNVRFMLRPARLLAPLK